MEYIGNRPPGNTGGYDPYDTGGYWWNYNNPYGAYDPYGYNTPVTSWEQQVQQSGGTAPTTPNTGQTTETPQGTPPDVDANGNPIFRTDVTGNAPPLDYTGSQIDPYLAEYLASLPQGGGGTGGGGVNFNVTGTDFMDPSYPFPGPYGDPQKIDANPPPGGEETGDPFKFEVTHFDTTDPDDPLSKKKIKTYWDFPQTGGTTTIGDPFQPAKPNPPVIIGDSWPTDPGKKPPVGPAIWPIIDKIKKVVTGGGGGGGGGTGGGGQQKQQQPGVGKLLAALPMLAAFQGGTTTTPAPYAHLGPHTPVAPVFKPQGRGNPIPSIGQLLAGVK